jgi:alkanesulfonate monooxygenase SsuD/methylene tetrahydromethanopterin reductase-like flavin-dependent oxidoreductase (luciferase family)
VWIGGHTDAALRRTATLGDGWHPIGMRSSIRLAPPEYAASARRIQTLAREAGRDPKSITLSLRVPMEVRPRQAKAPAGERPFFQGTAEQVAGDIRAYSEVGVTHFVFDSTHQDLGAVLANLERFAKDVAPAFGSRGKKAASRKAVKKARPATRKAGRQARGKR